MPTAALIIGTGLSAGGQILQGIQSQKAAGYEATQAEQQGQVESTNAYGEIAQNDIESNRLMAKVRTQAGASGVAAGSGSVRAVNSMNASMAILRDTYSKYKGNLAEQNAYYQAKALRYQGNQALYRSLVGAGSTALTSFFSYKGMQAGNLGLPPPGSMSGTS